MIRQTSFDLLQDKMDVKMDESWYTSLHDDDLK